MHPCFLLWFLVLDCENWGSIALEMNTQKMWEGILSFSFRQSYLGGSAEQDSCMYGRSAVARGFVPSNPSIAFLQRGS